MEHGEESKLRGALVGFGFIGSQGHLPAYLESPDFEIIAVADGCEARRLRALQALPRGRVYPDLRTLLAHEKPDFVDIAAPPAAHAELAHLALEHGLHVLCEKPLTVTVAEAESLIAKAREKKRVLMPNHNYRHAPVIRSIRKLIESGDIGDVRSITLNTMRNTHAKGVPDWNTHWRREKRHSGGGIVMDHGSHSFYLAFEWLRGHPIAVTAKTHNLASSLYDTEDNCAGTLTFAGGRLAHVQLSWTSGVRKVIYAIQGTKGAIFADDDSIQVALMKKTAGPDVAQGAVSWDFRHLTAESHWMDASHVRWFGSVLREFKTAIVNNDFISSNTVDALMCMRTIQAVYESSAQNCREVKTRPPENPVKPPILERLDYGICGT